MSDQITINVTPDPAFDLNVEEQDQNVYINPISLNEGVINHSVTHISGGSDELPHNSLGGLQGGASGQFYHLSSDEYVNLITGQVVRPNETGVFVTKSETGAFYAASNPSGFITGVDLSAYVTGDVVRPSETGAFYAASNPSGFITGVDLSNYATVSYTTGISGSLQNQISNLNNQTGNYVLKSQTGNFITQSQTGQFYSSNNPSGYTPTGYVTGVSGNLQDQITILNNQTGSFYPINNPSGYITGVDLSFSGNYYTKTESESRYVNTTGAETILGDKTFHDKVYINNLYVTGLETVVSTTNTNVASNYLMLNLTGGAVDGGIFFVTGSGLTGINDSGAIIGFDHSDKFKFGIGTRASDLSVLDTIASFEDVTGISGSLQTQISTLNNATGNYVLTSESGQFYPSSNPSGFITGIDLSAYVTGDVVRPSETGAFYAASNPSGFATVVDPVRTTLTGNGSTSIYTISGASGLVNPSALIVAIDGALQEPVVDYTIVSGNITFTSPLASGSKAVVISPTNTLQVSQMIPADGSVTSSKLDTNLSLAGDLDVGGQVQLANQVAVDSSSVMTKGISDARYFAPLRSVNFEFGSGWTTTATGGGFIFSSPSFLRIDGANGTNAGSATASVSNLRNGIGVSPEGSFAGIDFTNPVSANFAFRTRNFNIASSLNWAFIFGELENISAGISNMVRTGTAIGRGWVGIQCISGNVTIIAVDGTSTVGQSSTVDTCVNGYNHKGYRISVSGGVVSLYNSTGLLLGSLSTNAPITKKGFNIAALVDSSVTTSQIGIIVQHISFDW